MVRFAGVEQGADRPSHEEFESVGAAEMLEKALARDHADRPAAIHDHHARQLGPLVEFGGDNLAGDLALDLKRVGRQIGEGRFRRQAAWIDHDHTCHQGRRPATRTGAGAEITPLIPSVRPSLAPASRAPCRLALARLALVRSAPSRFASWRLAPIRLARRRSAPERSAHCKLRADRSC